MVLISKFFVCIIVELCGGEKAKSAKGEEIDQAVAILRALGYENKAAEYETMYRQFARENNDIKTME
ncbi:CTP synthase [Listeria monocytogenes N53-1]|nr:CTP synthase [Listeria monocytogenes]CCQ22771.1 CTP synthase [Listeria monocytogenes N53-1]